MASTHPYYRAPRRGPFHAITGFGDGTGVDLRYVHLPPYGQRNAVDEAARRFGGRTAEFVRAAAGNIPSLISSDLFATQDGLLKFHDFGDVAPQIYVPTVKCLAALAYRDFFPYVDRADNLLRLVNTAILFARPGWCGTIGPAIHDAPTFALVESEGNYDLTQMVLLPMAYRYYEKLSSDAREHLITELLARGRIHRVNVDDTFTSGGAPNDWSRAGFIAPLTPVGIDHIRIGETENHILQIHTARYLTNQLLYQRDHDPSHDNRRNGSDDSPTCMNLMLRLLRNFLRGDFSEYNAKSYSHETRTALLNLCSYAYDHEVRLAARMVLDYVSAHIAVSSCDLRRLVPFRRRNDAKNSKLLGESRFMDVGLLEWQTGSDHNVEHYVVQAGNTRAYETVTPIERAPVRPGEEGNVRAKPWSILSDGGDGMLEGLSDYRLPPSIHDLFVNDRHRRFFQKLHRTPYDDVESGQNCDNLEIYAGSPSYLITAGGAPAGYAINPDIAAIVSAGKVAQQLGVAVTTSFMPTGARTGDGTQNYARDLIQFSSFAAEGKVENLGVAPDFACGHVVHIPEWVSWDARHGRFFFVDRSSPAPDRPGFYLAFLRDGDFTVMEAYDTWLSPGLPFGDFVSGVYQKNQNLRLVNFQEAFYLMTNGNRVRFSIWNEDDKLFGARVYAIEEPPLNDVRPSQVLTLTPERIPFLSGTVMNSPAEAVIEITNKGLGTTLVLDMQDPQHPKRRAEDGVVEEAGSQNEVWVDFDWRGPQEGDFFHPFATLAGAVAAVADRGVVKILPGTTHERPVLPKGKRIRIEAAIGGVAVGAP